MKKQWIWEVIGLGTLLIVLVGISPAVGQSDKLGGDERPVMAALETPSFGAEDFIVASSVPPSFGTEDFIVASETPSFGAEDWIEGMEFSGAVATGTLPAPAR